MYESIQVDEFYQRWLSARDDGGSLSMIDVRSIEEHQVVHIPGVTLIPLHTLMARVSEIPDKEDVYLICHLGGRSAQAAEYLARQCGRKNLFNVEGGTLAWQKAGYPTDKA
ncbi:MAG: rhodanese-like domain-containing protein [Mariprofundus sp.]|nr:rhodanese-like domain-containing protein [Mariprofundus sp.]